MGSIVVDASVLLGIFDPADAHHHAADRSLRKAREDRLEVCLPASALSEVLVGASRVGEEAVRQTERFVDTIVDRVVSVDRSVARAAATLRARHRRLRLPDALVLATGDVIEADAVLTADAGWSKIDSRVQVIR
jgi:predicted nucleic acid-binding protein